MALTCCNHSAPFFLFVFFFFFILIVGGRVGVAKMRTAGEVARAF